MNMIIVDKYGVELKNGVKVKNEDNEECAIYVGFTGELYLDNPIEGCGEPLKTYISEGNVADSLEVIKQE